MWHIVKLIFNNIRKKVIGELTKFGANVWYGTLYNKWDTFYLHKMDTLTVHSQENYWRSRSAMRRNYSQ